MPSDEELLKIQYLSLQFCNYSEKQCVLNQIWGLTQASVKYFKHIWLQFIVPLMWNNMASPCRNPSKFQIPAVSFQSFTGILKPKNEKCFFCNFGMPSKLCAIVFGNHYCTPHLFFCIFLGNPITDHVQLPGSTGGGKQEQTILSLLISFIINLLPYTGRRES